MIELLVDNGANMDLALREVGSNFFFYKIYVEICFFNLILTHSQQLTPLMIACQEGFLEVVQVLLKKGASPNALDQVSYFFF